MTVFCLVEVDPDGAVADASLRALTLAREIPGALAAVVFGDPPVADLALYGAGDVYAVSGPAGTRRRPGRARWRACSPTGTRSSPLPPTGATRCSPIWAPSPGCRWRRTASPSRLRRTRPGPRAGLTRSSASAGPGCSSRRPCSNAPAALLTVATDGVPAVPAGVPGAAAVHSVSPALLDGDLAVCAAEAPASTGGASLATARVVVGGGRGVGSADGFASLDELASLLGGVVGVSRVVTSEGWRPHTQQVGQTGTKITPDVYLACGISGAIQHIAGCSGARHIIAINTDPVAPLMARADYAIIGDLHEVIPALVKALRDRS